MPHSKGGLVVNAYGYITFGRLLSMEANKKSAYIERQVEVIRTYLIDNERRDIKDVLADTAVTCGVGAAEMKPALLAAHASQVVEIHFESGTVKLADPHPTLF